MIQKFAIALVAVVLFSIGLGLLLPREWKVEQHIVINDSSSRIHPYVFDLKRWQEWSVWTRAMDPHVRHTYEGQQDGVGAKWSWLGPTMGHGQMEITAADPTRGVELAQAIESDVVTAHATLVYTPQGNSTKVTWTDEGTLPVLVGGFFRRVVEERLAADLASSLQKLKSTVEALPPVVTPARHGPTGADGGTEPSPSP